MPIDISLLRPSNEGGRIADIRRWQSLRRPPIDEQKNQQQKPRKEIDSSLQPKDDGVTNNEENNDWNEGELSSSSSSSSCLITALSKNESQRRSKTRELNHHRRLLNQSLRRRRRHGKTEKTAKTACNNSSLGDGDEEEVRRNDARQLIKDIEKELRDINADIEILLPQVGNKVDTTPLSFENESIKGCYSSSSSRHSNNNIQQCQHDTPSDVKDRTNAKNNKNDDAGSIIDPLFCIGGYETTWSFPNKQKVLTNIGSELLHTISHRAISFLNRHDFIMTHIPEYDNNDTLLTKQKAHHLLGCRHDISSSSSCRICSHENDAIPSPSSIRHASRHANKKYSEKSLPQRYVTQSHSHHLDNDDYTHPTPLISCYILCPSDEHDARDLQDDMIRLMTSFYQSLLPPSLFQKDVVMARMIQPHELTMRESRRIVVEGCRRRRRHPPSSFRRSNPPGAATNRCEEMMMVRYLGHVSNELDYVSRGLTIKLASPGSETMEYVYTLHCVFCDVVKTMEWLVEWGVVGGGGGGGGDAGGVCVSRDLLLLTKCEEEEEGVVIIPFQRRVRLNKHGKRVVVDVNVAKSKKTPGRGGEKKMNEMSSLDVVDGDRKGLWELGNDDHLVSQDEIDAEAMCNPYDFLPLNIS